MDSSSSPEEGNYQNEMGTTSSETGSKRKGTQTSAEGASDSNPKKKNTHTRSWVWDHFTRTKENRNKCRCNYCDRILCCSTANGTTCLKKHLGICKEHKVWQETRSQSQHVLNTEQEGTLKLSKVSEDVFREASNELIILAELPISFIECLAWRHFCSKVNLYKPHSRRTATRDIVEMFVKRKTELIKIIRSNKQRVSITTDIWTAPTTSVSYMVITAHYIDASWHLRKLIIGFKHVADHRGSTINSVLLECMAEWGTKKVFMITVDNATANTSALNMFRDDFRSVGTDALVLDGQFMHVRCCAHILNLVVQDGLHEVDGSVCAIRNVIHYVRASSKRVDSFEQKVDSGKMTRGSLSLDCKTRWNSTYLMLTRALKFRLAFDKMEAEDKLYNDYFEKKIDGKQRVGPPTKDDWDNVERLVKFLVIFYNSTLVVSASTSANSFKCYNEIVTIERNLISLSTSPDEKLRTKAKAMKGKFDKYWGGIKDTNTLLIVASVFDPRNKMKFAGLCFDMLYGKDTVESKAASKSISDVLKNLFDEYNSAVQRNVPSQSVGTSSQSGQGSQNDGFGYEKMDMENDLGYERMDAIYKDLVNEIGFEDPTTELELYLKEKVEIPKNNPLNHMLHYDVLGWWRVNSPKYLVLAAIAKDVLALQVSSVASESAFSNSNRILDSYRSCLTHYMIEVLLCTEQWLKCDLHLTEKRTVSTQRMLDDIEMQDEFQREFEAKCNFQG